MPRRRMILVVGALLLGWGCNGDGPQRSSPDAAENADDAGCADDEFRPAAPNDVCAPRCEVDAECGDPESCQRATGDGSVRVCWSSDDPLPNVCETGCIKCVGVRQELTGDLSEDLVGTWVSDYELIDTLHDIWQLRGDGTFRSVHAFVNGPDENGDPASINETTWRIDGTELVIGDSTERRREVWKVMPSSVNFHGERPSDRPWFRVSCEGFGFEDAPRLPESRCDDEPRGHCAEELADPDAECVELRQYWGDLALCGYRGSKLPDTLEMFHEQSQVAHFSGAGAFTCALFDDGSVECRGQPELTAPQGNFVALSAQGANACAIDTDSVVSCWGIERLGHLDVPDGLLAESITVGESSVCAVSLDGEVSCWGVSSVASRTPPDDAFEQIAIGVEYACGRTSAGELRCWGEQADTWSVPDASFTDVSITYRYACGVTTEGAVICWGDEPLDPPDETFVDIDVNYESACGIRADDSIACWGSSLPDSIASFQAIDVGHDNLCGLRTDGTLICWGRPFSEFRVQ